MKSRNTKAKSTAVKVAEPIDSTYPEAAPTFASLKNFPWLMPKINAMVSLYSNSRLGRSMGRYSMNKGALLAGGITYVALFSITGALTIAITVVMKILGGNPELQESVFHAINKQLPGVLAIDGQSGMVEPEQLIIESGFSLAGIIGIVVLIFSTSRLMTAVKRSIRAMFGIEKPPLSFINDKARDFLGLLAMLLAVVFTGISSALNSSAGTYLLELIGFSGWFGSLVMRIVSLILAAATDALVLWIMIRVVAGVRVPRHDALPGLAIGIVISAALRYLGTSAVGSVDSPMLASFAALITVLLWVNLLSRMMLMVSAFMANPPRTNLPVDSHHIHGDHTPNYVSVSDPQTLVWPHHHITGAIDLDWNANPNRPEQIDVRANYRGGPLGRWILRRLTKLEEKEKTLKLALRR